MWFELFLYLVIPIVVTVWILRRESVQEFLQPFRNKLYARHHDHQKKHHHGHEGMEQAKSILFENLKSIKSKVAELEAQGVIRLLEIGVGRGANFKHYPKNCHYIEIDPNPTFKPDAIKHMQYYPEMVLENFINTGAEDMSMIADESVDAVVTTAVMCSVKDMQKVFKEIQRVLVPGGKYYYLEHIAEEDNSKKYWLQTIVTTAYNVISYLGFIHGAHLNRKIDQEVLKAGFSSVNQQVTRFEVKNASIMMKLAERNAIGVATK